MDDLEFSFKDSIQACLPCFRPSTSHSGPNSNGVLEGLLRDPGTDTDAMSLHSSFGSARRKKKKKSKHMTLFGWDVFGRPKQAIQLPADNADDDDDLIPAPRRPTNISTSTINSESDATPVDPTSLASRLAARESFIVTEDARLKSERKQLRRERRELERAMRDFEVLREQQQHIHQLQLQQQQSSIANAQQQQQPKPKLDLGTIMRSIGFGDDGDEDGEDGADLGGGSYSRRAPPPSGSRSNGSHSRSDSQSRHSASYYAAPPAHMVPLPRSERDTRSPVTSDAPPPSSRRKAKSSTSNRSSSSAQSGSLASPLSTHPHNPRVASPLGADDGQEFEGFPGMGLSGGDRGGGFPSPKIGGGGRRERDGGAFLAQRGGDGS